MIDWRRQHIAAILVGFLSSLKEMIFTFIIIFIFGTTAQSDSNFTLFFLVFLLVISIISSVLKWWTFKYKLEEDELQVRRGIIQKKHRYIRKERVQSIDINANLIQRILGLVEVKIETAGGGAEPEFRLIALRRTEANKIKETLLEKKNGVNEFHHVDDLQEGTLNELEIEEKESASYTWKLTNKRLIIAAVTSSGIGIAATVIAALSSQLSQVIPESFYNQFINFILQSSIIFIAFWLVFILVISWLFTVIRTILKYGQFKIEKIGDDIHISRGILERRQLTLSTKRITTVRIVQNIFRQPFGYAAVYVESAGGGRADEDLSTIILPICKKSEINHIFQDLIPNYAFERNYQSLPKKSLRRYMVRLLVPSFILAGLMTYFFSYGWLAFILPMAASLLAYIQFKDAGIGQKEQYFLLKSRSLSLTEVISPRNRIQSMKATQHYFQSLDQLYSIHVSVLTSMAGKTFTLRHISEEQQERQLMWYSYTEEKDRVGQ